MDYIELDCQIEPRKPGLDIVIAALGEIGFESFEESEVGVKAYIQSDLFSEELIENSEYLRSNEFFEFNYKKKLIKAQNWNAVWESNFEPIVIAGVAIRAPFHEPIKNTTYDIVIEPKMSFGTGHHETTSLVVEEMLSIEFAGKTVLDMGSGTGILAILAKKLGAVDIIAVDIDEWAYTNSVENFVRNETPTIKAIQGDIESVKELHFDIILANINRNILLKQLPSYQALLNQGGTILFSGFLDVDISVMDEAIIENNLIKNSQKLKNKWALIRASKN